MLCAESSVPLQSTITQTINNTPAKHTTIAGIFSGKGGTIGLFIRENSLSITDQGLLESNPRVTSQDAGIHPGHHTNWMEQNTDIYMKAEHSGSQTGPKVNLPTGQWPQRHSKDNVLGLLCEWPWVGLPFLAEGHNMTRVWKLPSFPADGLGCVYVLLCILCKVKRMSSL